MDCAQNRQKPHPTVYETRCYCIKAPRDSFCHLCRTVHFNVFYHHYYYYDHFPFSNAAALYLISASSNWKKKQIFRILFAQCCPRLRWKTNDKQKLATKQKRNCRNDGGNNERNFNEIFLNHCYRDTTGQCIIFLYNFLISRAFSIHCDSYCVKGVDLRCLLLWLNLPIRWRTTSIYKFISFECNVSLSDESICYWFQLASVSRILFDAHYVITSWKGVSAERMYDVLHYVRKNGFSSRYRGFPSKEYSR